MHKITLIAALAASTAAFAGTASAQQRGGIIVVDSETIMETCTACRAATTQLQTQATAAQQFSTTLSQPLETEAKAIEAAAKALGAKAGSDAALQKRAQTFQQREASARQQLAQRQQTLRSTAQHVQQQIGRRLIAVVEQVRARRGAAIAINKNSTLANDNTVDVTSEVLAALNQQLPSVSVTPLPQQQQQQATGR
jgi:outer membrane protein